MPVTNSTMVIDRGSTNRLACTWRPPTGIQVHRFWVKDRTGACTVSRSKYTPTATTNEAPTKQVATAPASGSPSRLPASTWMAKPTRGSKMIRYVTWSIVGSALHQVQVVGGVVGPAAEDGDHDAQADHHLGRRHHQHEKHQDLAADVVEHVGEGDEGQVGRVEHQLHAHEHHQHVAADHDAEGADGEEHDPEGQVPVRVDAHESASPFAPAGAVTPTS